MAKKAMSLREQLKAGKLNKKKGKTHLGFSTKASCETAAEHGQNLSTGKRGGSYWMKIARRGKTPGLGYKIYCNSKQRAAK